MNQKETSPNPRPIKQLNFKVHEDFYWKLKNIAAEKRHTMIEILEKAFKFYEKREQIINEINTYRQTIQAIEQQMQTFQGSMSRAELAAKTNNLNPALFRKIGLVIAHQILKETLEQFLKEIS